NTNKNWLKHLLLENNQRQKYIRNNRSVFVHEDPKFLCILPQHSNIITAIQEKNPVYILLKVPNVDSNLHKKLLIPLILGYKVFIYYGSCYCTIELGWCKQTFEKSDDLHQYLENLSTLNYNSHLSLSFLLGLTTTENVKWLCGYVVKRDANSLEAEIEQGIQTDLTFNLQKSDIDSTLIQAMSNKIIKMQKELNNTKKRLCRSHQTLLQNYSEDDECSNIESDQDLSETPNLQEILNLLITKGKLGSTVFVSTEIFLELILRQPCPKLFYKNETDGVDYSKLVARARLVGGVNREEWVTMLCTCGIIHQSGKNQYFQKQEAFFQKIQESVKSSANFALHAACEQVKSQVAVNGDINSNKTLANQPIVSKIFADLKHKAATLKEEFGSAPILLLTATCSEYMASQLSINLKCFSLNIICNIQIYRPELKLQVLPKPVKKDKLLDAIFKIINETTTG
ncbi:11238_t:CDS:2, partial [Cetraspora pellucida]